MARYYDFKREDIFPSFFPDRLQDFLAGARTDLRLVQISPTKIGVVPDADIGVAAISVDGRWRFNSATVERAHPGGEKGTYTVWAVALDNDIDNEPDPFTDHTEYAFDLRITNGADPSGAGVEIFQKIGEIDWSGAAIEALRQTYGSVTGPQIATGALSSEAPSDITWTRAPGGGLLANINNNAIGSAELADGAVDTEAIVNLAVTTAKIAVNAITESKVSAGAINTNQLAALAVTAAKIAALAITEEKLAGEAVSTAKIQNLAVTAAKLAAEAVETGKIKNLAVTAAKIAEATVTDAKLASPNNVVWKTIFQGSLIFSAERGIGLYLIQRTEGAGLNLNAENILGVGPVDTFGLNPGDYAVAGKKTLMRIQAQTLANGVKAAGCIFTPKLLLVGAVSGAANLLEVSLDTKSPGIEGPAIESPAAGRHGWLGPEVEPPPADVYAFGVDLSGAKMPAGSVVQLGVQLQVHHV